MSNSSNDRPHLQGTMLSFLSFVLFFWVICVATPFEIIINNKSEFAHIPGTSLLMSGVGKVIIFFIFTSLAFMLCSIAFQRFIGNRFRRIILSAISSVAISAWMNATFFVGSYGELDGATVLDIEPLGALTLVQIGVFALVFLTLLKLSENIKTLFYAVGAVLFVSMSTTAINASLKITEASIGESTEAQYFQYSSNNPNLLYIVLDEYQTDYFADILTDKISNELDGFIWFKDAMANFPTTKASYPAMLTGQVYGKDEEYIDLLEFYNDVSDQSIANKFYKNNANVTFTKGSPMGEVLFPPNTLVSFSTKQQEHLLAYLELLNLSIFRSAPDIIKNHVINNGEWLISSNRSDLYHIKNNIGHAVTSMHYFANADFKAAEGPTTFKSHHTFITHSPTIVGRDCAFTGNKPVSYEEWDTQKFNERSEEGRCAIQLVSQIIRKLKEINVFDNTMIIVTADHGSWNDPEEFANHPHVYSRSAPTLLIKPLNNKNEFEISDFPAVLSDLPKTIADAFSMENDYPGYNLLSDSNPTERVRTYNDYLGIIWRTEPFKKYTVNGTLNDPMSWSGNNFQAIRTCGKAIDFSEENQLNDYQSSGLGEISRYGRWTNGKSAQIEFKTSDNCDAKSLVLKLNAFVTPDHPVQSGKVYINGNLAGIVAIHEDKERPKNFTFVLPKSKNNTYSVKIDIDNPVQPKSLGLGDNTLDLGFRFVQMELSLDEAE